MSKRLVAELQAFRRWHSSSGIFWYVKVNWGVLNDVATPYMVLTVSRLLWTCNWLPPITNMCTCILDLQFQMYWSHDILWIILYLYYCKHLYLSHSKDGYIFKSKACSCTSSFDNQNMKPLNDMDLHILFTVLLMTMFIS